MKNALDALQVILQTPVINTVVAPFLFIALITAIKAAAKIWRYGWVVLREIKSVFPKIGIKNAIFCGLFVIFVTNYGGWLALQVEYVETRYIDPVYVGQFAYSSDHVTAIYEQELRRHVDDYEFKIIQDSVRAMSLHFGCDSSAIYECAYPECGLNPFIIRSDGVAAGFIQFTNAGCESMPFKLSDVKEWCRTRNTRAMMSATRQYLQAARNGRQMRSGLDVYLAVFCPRELGSGTDAVLYNSGEAYRLNSGIDGWVMNHGRIYRSPAAVDGSITVGELGRWMEAKKINLIKKSVQ